MLSGPCLLTFVLGSLLDYGPIFLQAENLGKLLSNWCFGDPDHVGFWEPRAITEKAYALTASLVMQSVMIPLKYQSIQ